MKKSAIYLILTSMIVVILAITISDLVYRYGISSKNDISNLYIGVDNAGNMTENKFENISGNISVNNSIGNFINNSINESSDALINYDDVAVIVNDNSQLSRDIGDYFANARAIPKINIIHIRTSTNEEINNTGFQDIRNQIEQYILENGLNDSIDYIVTTKDVPLKVKYNDDSCASLASRCASVDSELTLILGPYSENIMQPGAISDPYYSSLGHFSRRQYGIFLATRLDGYDFNDIKNMIDRSGPDTKENSRATYVFDQDPSHDPSSYNTNMAEAKDILLSQHTHYNIILDNTSIFLTNQSNVLGYVSWGSNDANQDKYTQNAIPNNSWAPGAIAETYVSSSGRSFAYPPSYGQSLIADLVHEGVSGAKGYVYEPYVTALAKADILFPKYDQGYNLAESFYASSMFLSWMDIVIGDPKTTITYSESAESVPVSKNQATQ